MGVATNTEGERKVAKMSLHFSSERPEDQFYTDFSNLNKFSSEVWLKQSFQDSVTL